MSEEDEESGLGSYRVWVRERRGDAGRRQKRYNVEQSGRGRANREGVR